MVEVDIRWSADDNVRRAKQDFPPAAKLVKYHVSSEARLVELMSGSAAHNNSILIAQYVSFQASLATFDNVFKRETEITGYAAVKLYIQCINYPDVDLFVALQKINVDGKEIKFSNLI